MAGYQVETFQRASAIHAQQIIRRRSAVIHLLAISFFISCITRLWDVVGNFLGHRSGPKNTRPAWRCGGIALFGVLETCNHFK
ncbi:MULTISPECIES: hypothetical protein [Pseudomonas]|uniref:hypothetical protein n=2 Tax=Pseudomonas TaxID=286 RepID=UPI00111DF285|nr:MULTISPECIES: hypothetical protein [Pseudomonas]